MNNAPFPGSRWFKFEFHCHTKASSDYGKGLDEDTLKARSHEEWVLAYMRAGLDCVAITDHNCGDAIDEVKAAVESLRDSNHVDFRELTIFPGVELSVNGAHFLALFDPSAATRTVQDLLARLSYDGNTNNAEGYCTVDFKTLSKEVSDKGGILIPAHVDSPKGVFNEHSSLSSLNPILQSEIYGMEVIEENYSPPGLYTSAKVNWSRVLGSDSHHPTGDTTDPNSRYPGSHYTWVKMGTPSIESLKLALIDGNGVSLFRSTDSDCPTTPNEAPSLWLKSLTVEKTFLMGNQAPEEFQLSPWFNTIVGGRGSGKSSLVHFLRATLDREQDLEALRESDKPTQVEKTFTDFHKVNKNPRARGSLGALRSTSKTSVEISKDGHCYQVHLDAQEGRSTEDWFPALDDWKPSESHEVHSRFPVRIFSQNEIATISDNPNALLELIDSQIEKSDWQERFDEAKESFEQLNHQLLNLENNEEKLVEIKTQLTDLNKKLVKFEDEDNKKILDDYDSHQKILKAVKAQRAKLTTLSNALAELQELEDPDPAIASAQLTSLPSELLTHLQETAELARTAKQVISELQQSLATESKELTKSLLKTNWRKSYNANKAQYQTLSEEFEKLTENGREGYAHLKKEQETLQNKISETEKQITRKTQLEGQVSDEITDVLSLRQELTKLRMDFLQETLDQNQFVRIEVIPFGDSPHELEESFRNLIDKEDSTFAKDIYVSEEGDSPSGLIHTLLNGLDDLPQEARETEFTTRLQTLKNQLIEGATGKEQHFRIPFCNHLEKLRDKHSDFTSHIENWYPEDSLSLQYSPSGDGKGFTELAKGSTGQKCAALLAFILSFGSEPLILDQPEDDLDNSLITDLICRQLKENKRRRQIIVITHNPNIVVNGDAEMIHALHFSGGQCRTKSKGALQNPNVRNDVCDILEGGKTAIESRYRRLV